MRIFRHYQDIPDAYKGAVVAIGNFDGVHRGHHALIAHAASMAEERSAPLGVLTFEPHPQEFFRPGATAFRLTPFRTKARLIAEAGADVLFAQVFNSTMAGKAAHQFVLEVLVGGLGVCAVVVGPDFQFGHARSGNVTMLSYMGEMEGFGVSLVSPIADEQGEKVSSTCIRQALVAGRPEEAARLLGRYWSIESRVVHGDARGRQLGFPTANSHLDDYLVPAYGVYAVRATIYDNEKPVGVYDGVTNLGIRPMFQTPDPLLETYLFGFSGDLYGKHLGIELVRYLRPEAKFDTIEALKTQILKDCEQAKQALASEPAFPLPKA